MTTKQIDYCIEVAHTLNFSRAADNLFVSQPTFSYQIRLLEEEIGFTIFERNGKGAALTPAGAQFVTFLTSMREDLKRAIEQGQNFSAKYKDSISISLMVRPAVYFLPEAMRIFAEKSPEVQILPVFQYEGGVETFLRNEVDILFALKEQTRQIPGIHVHDLFESHIYLIAQRDTRCQKPDYRRRSVRQDTDGRRRISAGIESCPAQADRDREDRLFQQCGPRYDAHQCGSRAGRLPGARVPQ